jgi:MFS family permease
VIGLGGIGNAVGALSGGIIADRWVRRPAMLVSAVCAALTMLALGRTTNRTVILVLALLHEVFLGIVRPAFNAAIIDVVLGGDRMVFSRERQRNFCCGPRRPTLAA